MTMTPLRRRGAGLATALLSAALILSACVGGATTGTPATSGTSATTADDTSATSPTGTRQIEADNGTIEVSVDPQRVAAIGNASLPFIDLGGTPVGVTEMRASALNLLPAEQKATFEAAVNLGPSGGEVDLEKLASLEPDLILAQMPTSDFEQLQKQLESIAPTVFFGLGTDWKTLADAFAVAGNKAESLSEQKSEFAARVAKIQETYREIINDTSFVALDRYASSESGTFVITHIGCVEIAQDEVGLNLPEHPEGNNGEMQSFEQIGELSKYDVILYPVDAEGQATEPFAPVVESNSWKALPAVNSGHALGVFCPGNNSYGAVLRYLDSLDRGLATLLPTDTTSATRKVEADNGIVEVPADPQRVATLGRATGSFLALDGEPIAVTELSTGNFDALLEHQQAAYKAATNLGASGSEADLEKLASLEPDLIFISVPNSDFEQMKSKKVFKKSGTSQATDKNMDAG